MLEKTLAFHCAPALAGIKPANLVCCSAAAYPDLEQEVRRLNAQLNPCGIVLLPMCRCGERLLLLVYRRRVLESHLADIRVRTFLRRAGYTGEEAETLLAHLRKRLGAKGGFPHELGIFLGYPPEDVEGFQRNAGKNCKLSGYWKVYGDADKARQMFYRFTRCRNALCARVNRGASLTEVFQIA